MNYANNAMIKKIIAYLSGAQALIVLVSLIFVLTNNHAKLFVILSAGDGIEKTYVVMMLLIIILCCYVFFRCYIYIILNKGDGVSIIRFFCFSLLYWIIELEDLFLDYIKIGDESVNRIPFNFLVFFIILFIYKHLNRIFQNT